MSTSMMNFRDSPGHIQDKDLPGVHLGMPHIGLGTWYRDSASRPKPSPTGHPKLDLCSCRPRRESTGCICQIALDKGCKLIDTAKSYRTDYAVAAAVDLHCISRSAVFVTTKVDEQGATEQEARHLLLQSILVAGGEKGYVDLLLIDSPQQSGLHGRKMMWIELEKLHREGKAKAIGVSNYTEERIMEMRQYATVWPPQVNQLIVNPWFPAEKTVDFCHRNGIVVQAASPFHNGALLDDQIVQVVARKLKQSPAQVLVRWSLQNGCVPLPRTSKWRHLYENLEVMDFKLSNVQMGLLDNLTVIGSGRLSDLAQAKAELGLVMPRLLP